MSRKEAAAKWAEAAEHLEKCLKELEQAQAAHNAASIAEREAYEAVEALAGRGAEVVAESEGQKRFWPRDAEYAGNRPSEAVLQPKVKLG